MYFAIPVSYTHLDVYKRQLIRQARPALEGGKPVRIEIQVRNHNRTFGAMLSGRVADRYGHAGLPEDCISIRALGTAGQSFGAWLARGITVALEGCLLYTSRCV